MLNTDNTIEVLGARVHNLKNIDVSIPREKLVNHRAFGFWKIIIGI
jgi:excinuclease UvrABC ATPase subunit